MFTGLVQALGRVETAGPTQLKIDVSDPDGGLLQDLALGDSVAVDGVCLTVESQGPQGFIATVSPETVDRTCLGQRSKTRTPVNLESSLRVGGKIGGHFVTGHVDGVGMVQGVVATATAWEMTFGPVPDLWGQWQAAIAPYLVNKGSIAVNGISLTVARCDRHSFTVAVIPHTYGHTNLAHLTPGSWVNLEGDILGKYVEKFLTGHRGETSLSLDFLTEHGYH
ncbi:MAG: riboflavin synthase [Spirulina sp. DLM2.Bin59]|nr:MAG: riboflavin synthase [Spirulina sp. DLM2.Bin59]